jgi:putative transcriptional regulator
MTKTKKTKMGQSILKGLKQALAYEQGMLPEGERARYRVHDFSAIDVVRVRKASGMTQHEFSRTFYIPLKTLRNWEQGERVPRGTASILLKIIERNPKAVLEALRV